MGTMRRLRYFSWRREWPAAGAAAALLLAVYWLTAPPGAVFEDAGMIAAVCYDFGVLHPSGYPLYTLLCAPFARLADISPLNPARAAALFSSFAAAAACMFFYEIARRLGVAVAAAAAAAAMLGLGARFWSQALIAEVYTLNALLVAATLAALLRTMRAPARRRVLWLFFLGGLGLANHWPLYAVNIPAFALLFAAGRPWRRIPPARLAGGACMTVLGLSPYLYLFLRPHWGAPLAIFPPPQEWGAALAYILREPYAREIPATAALEWTRCAESALWGARLLAAEYWHGGAVAAVWGAFHFLRRRPFLWSAAAVWGAAASAPLLGGYLCGDSGGGLSETVFAAYPLPAMIFVAIFTAEGLARLPLKPQIAAAAALAASVFAVNLPQNNRSADRLAEEYAAAVLESLPPDSVLTASGDFLFPVFYLRHALGARPDIIFTNSVQESEAEKYAGRRRFYTTYAPAPDEKSVRDWGILQERAAAGGPEPLPRPLFEFYRKLPEYYSDFDSPVRQWDKIFVRRGIFDAARALSAAENLPPERELLRAALVKTPEGLFGELTARIRAGTISAGEIRDALAVLRGADGLLPAWRAQILHREGVLDVLAGRLLRAREKFRRALDLDLAANNPALVDLLHLLAAGRDWEEYRRLRRRYWMAENPALDGSDAQCAEESGAPCRTNPDEN